MPKYWVKNYFAHGLFLEVGQKQKTEEKKKQKLNDGDNNGQATHGACKPPGPIVGDSRGKSKIVGDRSLLAL